MILNLDTQNTARPFGDQEIPARVKSLIGQFIRDRYTNALISNPAVQREFGIWLEEYYGDRTASAKSQRQEMRMVRATAERGTGLDTLAEDMDRLVMDSRNPVPNKDVNYKLSHLITRDTFERMARYADTAACTLTQRDGMMVFVATCMTGLRTSEWATATLERLNPETRPGEVSPHPTLVTQTAKTKSNTSDTRTLILEGFSEGNLQVIQTVIQLMASASPGLKASLVREMRQALRQLYRDNSEHYDLMSHVDYRTARKLFTVESRRGGATQKQTAAALGHTTTVNLRWYAQGDVRCPRKTALPLARAGIEAADSVRDTLQELNERRQVQGLSAIHGYPEQPGLANPNESNAESHADDQHDDRDPASSGNSFLDKL
ncbi:hypothetical protein [Marinobacter gelidimuriae]|uniref:hypothetical protein n=1 Tax=Marinobacter gelidimuriae TaxID=2739064 RepID=UPI00035CDE92|nr:hypothetical protein [Marinobacter gelidimuriae]